MFLSSYGGPRWPLGSIAGLSLLATAQRQWLVGFPHIDEFDARRELARRLTLRLWRRDTAALRRRDRLLNCDWRDGPLSEFTLSLAWTPALVLRVQSMVGYAREHAASEL